ncbi:MAG: DUF624 domain-containing protein [Chloroflexota bacterium]|nr:MAG: DUF624 domain-containing protein [Chloroflexota bacterium]
MISAFRIFYRALELWWKDFISLTLINIIWALLQIPIITGPPATAAVYAITRQIADEELMEPGYAWIAFRQNFWHAWKWGLANLVIFAVLLWNYWAYQNAAGIAYTVLRLAWGLITFLWFTANVYYWPFWMAQDQKSFWLTLKNCFQFIYKRPALALGLGFICAITFSASSLIVIPLISFAITWISLIGVLAVDLETNKT